MTAYYFATKERNMANNVLKKFIRVFLLIKIVFELKNVASRMMKICSIYKLYKIRKNSKILKRTIL